MTLRHIHEAHPATAELNLEDAVAWLLRDHERLRLQAAALGIDKRPPDWISGDHAEEAAGALRATASRLRRDATGHPEPMFQAHCRGRATRYDHIADLFERARSVFVVTYD